MSGFGPVASLPVAAVPPTGEAPPVFHPEVGEVNPMLTRLIPSYLYWEYRDDDDLQAFVAAFNQLAQGYVDWFNDINLPIYTGAQIFGALLDWVGQGVYGVSRPVLPSGFTRLLGPLNTYMPNVLRPNESRLISPTTYYATTDDVYKRIITWQFYKGDGRVCDTVWLKRRIMRFLIGTDGTAPSIDNTYQISVTYAGGVVTINILAGIRRVVGGAIPNVARPNRVRPNQVTTTYTPFAPLALAPIFKAAVDAGVLSLPMQHSYVVNV